MAEDSSGGSGRTAAYTVRLFGVQRAHRSHADCRAYDAAKTGPNGRSVSLLWRWQRSRQPLNKLQHLLRPTRAQLLQEAARLVETIGGDASADRIAAGLPSLKVIVDIEASCKNCHLARCLTK